MSKCGSAAQNVNQWEVEHVEHSAAVCICYFMHSVGLKLYSHKLLAYAEIYRLKKTTNKD